MSGQRRTLAARYLKSVNPGKPEDIRKVLKVFELVFMRLEEVVKTSGGSSEGGVTDV